jgi:hypothetical protein
MEFVEISIRVENLTTEPHSEAFGAILAKQHTY